MTQHPAAALASIRFTLGGSRVLASRKLQVCCQVENGESGEFTVWISLKNDPAWILISIISEDFLDLTQTLALSWLEDKSGTSPCSEILLLTPGCFLLRKIVKLGYWACVINLRLLSDRQESSVVKNLNYTKFFKFASLKSYWGLREKGKSFMFVFFM